MSERRCPKCGGDMEEGFLPEAPHWKPGWGIFGYLCKNCGYVEFYTEK